MKTLNFFTSYLRSLVVYTQEKNRANILSLITKDPNARMIDLGCDEGSWTEKLGEKICSRNLFGSEVVEDRRLLCEKKGIRTYDFDLNVPFPIESNSFDVVHSNQVIEHLYDTDNFISECFRILKPGGYTLVSTVNLASWHNIMALVFGFQPFDFANISTKGTIGNPFSLWKGEISENELKSWQHIRLFTPYALTDFHKRYGFTHIETKSAGYYPLPNIFGEIDRSHAHMYVIKLQKPSM